MADQGEPRGAAGEPSGEGTAGGYSEADARERRLRALRELAQTQVGAESTDGHMPAPVSCRRPLRRATPALPLRNA